MDPARLRAWWSHRQGLDGTLAGATAAKVLDATGWARSVGGATPYLALHARAGIGRAAADAAAVESAIHELPAARGCTYVVPAAHYALALTVGRSFNESNDKRIALKLGVTEKEIDRLCAKVLDTLRDGPLDPEQIKARAGSAVKDLGEEGKKKGLATTLPVALATLQSAGEIRRIAVNGRFDSQRYRYARWSPNPCAGFPLTLEESLRELARLYWKWAGPATLSEFQWFSGLGVKAGKEAVAGLGLVTLEEGSERLIFPEDLDALRAFRVPKEPRFALVSSLDGIALLRRGVKDLLPGPAASFPRISGLSDLPSHAIVDRGALAGLWEFDPERAEIAWMSFEKAPKTLQAEVERVSAFVRDELGDARTFSLDSPKSRAPRIQALRNTRR
ncbi:MAG: winged helix DNA-binding domain-containing protein [Acidobacteria bacterium]|nr:winged helix DNA-binding domain-containing protein [Acidobacteriota bacterium]